MTDKLPPNLLALFAPRPPLRWVEAPDYAPEKRKTAPVSGLAAFLPALEAAKAAPEGHPPTESWLEARDRKQCERKAEHQARLAAAPVKFKPNEDQNIRGDPFKTLIVARLSYEATHKDLEQEFGRFGPIERIRIVVNTHAHLHPNRKKKPHRGYAFIVFEREKDMKAAFEACDGMRIKDRRIKVDVERGRTVRGWKPRWLGGGLGGRGSSKLAMAPSRPFDSHRFGGPRGGGFRGGFDGPRRGGFRGSFGGGRGGFGGGGYRGNGFGPPSHAPSGPGGGRGFDAGPGGYRGDGGEGRSVDDNRFGGRDGGRYGHRDRADYGDHADRDGDFRRTGANMVEPARTRDSGESRGRDGGYGRGSDRYGHAGSRDDRPPRDGDRPPRDGDRPPRDGDRPPRDGDRPRDDDRFREEPRKRGPDAAGAESEPRKHRRY